MQPLVLRLNFGLILRPVLPQLFGQRRIVQGQHLRRQIAGILGPGLAHGQGRHRNAAGHLHRGQQGVQPAQRAAVDGYADHRPNAVGGHRPGQMRRHASPADEGRATALHRLGDIAGGRFRGSVRGGNADFMAYSELLEHGRAGLHDRPVGFGSHQDSDETHADLPSILGKRCALVQRGTGIYPPGVS